VQARIDHNTQLLADIGYSPIFEFLNKVNLELEAKKAALHKATARPKRWPFKRV
jgi:hypothetical protein